jgi:hypothetical protein
VGGVPPGATVGVVESVSVELPGADPEPLLDLLEGARFANVIPGVDAAPPRPQSPLSDLFRARGPDVPLGTWTPDELGIQHATGTKALARLADAGVPLPPGWRKVEDHPRRGLVVRPDPGADRAAAVGWLLRAMAALNPHPVTGPWLAVVRR